MWYGLLIFRIGLRSACRKEIIFIDCTWHRMNIIVQRPRDLTRAGLKSLRLELDAMGYSDTSLRRAWSDILAV